MNVLFVAKLASIFVLQFLCLIRCTNSKNALSSTFSKRRYHLPFGRWLSPRSRTLIGNAFLTASTSSTTTTTMTPPTTTTTSSSPLHDSSSRNSNNNDILTRLRGGDQVEKEDEEDEDEESPVQIEKEEDDKDDEEDKEEKEEPTSKDRGDDLRLSKPVQVVVQAKMSRRPEVTTTIFDQKVEITLQRRRSVAELKENLRKALFHKPPTSLMQIVHEGRILHDETSLDQLIDDDDDDDEDDDGIEDDGAGEVKGTLHLILDMIPPVDGKSFQSMSEKLQDLTTAELLRLYAANEAALQEISLSLYNTATAKKENDDDDNKDKEPRPVAAQLIPKLDERTDVIERQLKDMLLLKNAPRDNEKVRSILEETRPPSTIQAVAEIRGERVRDAIPSRGVKTSLRRKIQHTFNVQSWPDTIRYMCLFLFFGWFGGRTPMSRFILLLGAPSVLVLQARPVKLFWKQLLYTLILDPPGILLSLLPAPQQAIFHLNVAKEMETIYGPYTTETKELLKAKKEEEGKKAKKMAAPRTWGKASALAVEEEFVDAEEDEFFDAQEDEEEEEEEEEDNDEEDE